MNQASPIWQKAFRRLGMGLPKRELRLSLGLPRTNRQDKPELDERKLAQELNEIRVDARQLFRKVQRHLSRLNRYQVSPDIRQAHANACLDLFYPIANRYVKQFAEDGRVPEHQARKDYLDLIIDGTQEFLVCLKHIFQSDYGRSNQGYAKYRKRVYWAAFHILELIRFEQRVDGLRYRPLGAQSWRDASVIYGVMRTYESVSDPQTLLSRRLEAADMLARRVAAGPVAADEISMEELFVLIQIMGVLDLCQWPTALHSTVEFYVKAMDKPVKVLAASNAPLKNGQLIVYYGQDRAAYFLRDAQRDEAPGPAFVLDCRRLVNVVYGDGKAVVRGQAEQNIALAPRSLKTLKQSFRIPMMRLLHRQLARDAWGRYAMGMVRREDLRIYSGFDEVLKHLNQIFYPADHNRGAQEFKNILAQRSAMIGADDKATVESLWYIIEDTEDYLHIRTQESRYTVPLWVGSLMAFGVSQEGINRPSLGYVARIERPQPRQVNIVFRRLVSYAEPVVLKKMAAGSNERDPLKPISGFLVHDSRKSWGLLFQQHPAYWSNTQILLARGRKQKLHFRLGKLQGVTHEFFLFALHGDNLRELGVPTYPAVRTVDLFANH